MNQNTNQPTNQNTHQNTFNILPIFGILILSFLICFLVNIHTTIATDQQIAYDITETQAYTTFTVDQIIKAKGEEDVYCLTVHNTLPRSVQIPASTYKKYIGEGNNAFEYKTSAVTFYVAGSRLAKNFKGATTYTLMRYAFPWEDEEIAFTDVEVVEFKSAISTNTLSEAFPSFTFEVDNTIRGTHERATLPNTAQLWSERTSSKPAANNTSSSEKK